MLTLRELKQRHLRERGEMLDRQLSEIEALREAQANSRVPAAPLAAAVLAVVERSEVVTASARRRGVVEEVERVSWSGLARAVYGERPDQTGKGDGTRLQRALGLVAHTSGWYPDKTIDYDLATKIAYAAGLDPHEAGL